MISCTRRLTFCAGHRVKGHESKCAHLHGHNYVVWITAEAALDSIGRIIDFSVLKATMGEWLEKEWDHGFVLFNEDQEAIAAVNSMKTQKLYLMPTNPTAENMAQYLLTSIAPQLLAGTGVVITKIVIGETENCSAEATT